MNLPGPIVEEELPRLRGLILPVSHGFFLLRFWSSESRAELVLELIQWSISPLFF